MTTEERNDEIARTLARLPVQPPPGLADDILGSVGLIDRITTVPGPLGPLRIQFNDTGIVSCTPIEHWDLRTGDRFAEVDELPRSLGGAMARALETGRLGDLSIDLSALSEFQQAVLRKTAEIPPGEVRPYGWVAKEIGRPGAVRAVGNALNRNPIPIIVPCHRVSRSDGHLGRYAYGTEMKRRLLAGEGLDADGVEALADRGVRYTGSDTTHIFCHPTCRAARRIQDAHRVDFRTERAATDAGYRPCKLCRPATAA